MLESTPSMSARQRSAARMVVRRMVVHVDVVGSNLAGVWRRSMNFGNKKRTYKKIKGKKWISEREKEK